MNATTSIKNRWGLALSGGSDSMALLHWALAQKPATKLYAATVDHNLRSSAISEAQTVSSWCKQLGVNHTILTLTEKPSSVADARTQRYESLKTWYDQNKIETLLLGHHQDDQIETFLLRLQRGSGLQGLCGMYEHSQQWGMHLWRPLLNIFKRQLQETLISCSQPWFEDPSNQNQSYDRNALRQVIQNMPTQRIAKTTQHLQRAQDTIQYYVDQFLEAHAILQNNKYVAPRKEFEALPQEVALRVLTHMLCKISKKDYPPRFERLLNIYNAKKSIESYGCHIVKSDTIEISSL